jgi:hypothetical protein
VTAGGVATDFEHPCFAWVGRFDRDQWTHLRFYKPNLVMEDEHYDAFYKALMESSLRHEVGFNATKMPNCIEVGLSVLREQPFWRVLRVLKFGFKLFTYNPTVSKRFTSAILEGCNFQEASFVVGDTYGYHYPQPAYKLGEEQVLLDFLEGGPMVDLEDWHKLEENQGYIKYINALRPFKDVTGGALGGAYGACHPLTMNWDSFIFSAADADRRGFEGYTFKSFLKGIERIKEGLKNA